MNKMMYPSSVMYSFIDHANIDLQISGGYLDYVDWQYDESSDEMYLSNEEDNEVCS